MKLISRTVKKIEKIILITDRTVKKNNKEESKVLEKILYKTSLYILAGFIQIVIKQQY